METIKVGIIGCGYAGIRFLRTFLLRKKLNLDIEVNAVCDNNPDNLKLPRRLNIPVYLNISTMFLNKKYDIIVVTTNERWRFSVLKELLKYKGRFKRIISEKLLTEKLEQATYLLKFYEEHEISIHFVERCSLIIVELFEWIQANKLYVRRADFFWGKERLFDHRPTIGVISEMSHPIDVILTLANQYKHKKFKLINGTYSFSNYSCLDNYLLETACIQMKIGENLYVCGCSSFLLAERERRISIYLSNNEDGNISYIARLKFDQPFWNNDMYSVYKIKSKLCTKEKMEVVFNKNNTMNKENVLTDKMLQFVNVNIDEVRNNNAHQNVFIARLSQAYFVQEIVDAILLDSNKRGVQLPNFCARNKSNNLRDIYEEKMFNVIQNDSMNKNIDFKEK